MNDQEKELLIKDLCARYLYGVKFDGGVLKDKPAITLVSIDPDYQNPDNPLSDPTFNGRFKVNEIKPYLRPMSSMTEEEREEYNQFIAEINGCAYHIDPISQMDWLNKNMFDYRGLIKRGLALEAPEWMYNS